MEPQRFGFFAHNRGLIDSDRGSSDRGSIDRGSINTVAKGLAEGLLAKGLAEGLLAKGLAEGLAEGLP